MESIANGTPVIASNIGGIPELVQDKFNGELFAVENIEQLRNQILKLYSQADLLNEYINNSRKNCYLSVNQYSKKIIQLYCE